MRNTMLVVILFFLYALSSAGSLTRHSMCLESSGVDNPVSKNLILDQNFADYVNNQLKADNLDQVIIWADSILVDENVTFQHADLVLICNYFSTGNKEISIMPNSKDSTERDLSGQNGKHIKVIAKAINEARFYLPGGNGLPGKNGRNGRNGKRSEAKPTPQGASLGTPGGDGKPGGNGGSGGQLTVFSFNEEYNITFRAPGGKGGQGGKGGKGGISYVAKVSKVINFGKPNEKIIYTIGTKKEKDGQPGKSGARGEKGKFSKSVIDDKTFDDQVQLFFSADPNILDKTGWQIILTSNAFV